MSPPAPPTEPPSEPSRPVASEADGPSDVQAMQDLAVRWTHAQPAVAAFIGSLVPDYHGSQEVLGRTAAALVAKHERYDGSRPFVGWAIGVARLEVLRYRQERVRDRHVFDDETVRLVAEAHEQVADEVPVLRAALQQCLSKMKGRTRQVFALHVGQGEAVAAVAERLNLSSGAASVALHRGRVWLRNCVEKRLASEGGVS